jgi:dTDP-D-glucose 4,6-dehydratase
LDCLTGYLSIVELLINTQRSGIWNIGPRFTDYKPVNEIVNHFTSNWPNKIKKSLQPTHYHETNFLTLDSSKIMKESGWRNFLDFEKSLLWTSNWYNKTMNLGISPLDATMEDISLYNQLINFDNC